MLTLDNFPSEVAYIDYLKQAYKSGKITSLSMKVALRRLKLKKEKKDKMDTDAPIDKEVNVIKRGETCIQAFLNRSPAGLTITVRAHPRVEDFIRSLGSGEQIDVKTLGRHWVPIGGKPLMVYHLATNPGNIQASGKTMYNINQPGQPLLTAHSSISGINMDVLNLGFLRLAGISEGQGVSFGVKGVFTYEALQRLGSSIEEAAQQFYRSYIKPINLVVTVSTQEFAGNTLT